MDNNQHAVFFGPQGDTRWNQSRLASELKGFVHHELDIRDRAGVLAIVKTVKPSVIVHTAAQPSHDGAGWSGPRHGFGPDAHYFGARILPPPSGPAGAPTASRPTGRPRAPAAGSCYCCYRAAIITGRTGLGVVGPPWQNAGKTRSAD